MSREAHVRICKRLGVKFPWATRLVIAFKDHLPGRHMSGVLEKRFARYGLTLHRTKTRFVDFRFRRPKGRHPKAAGTTFDFLGFTHVWGQSRNGKTVVRQITAKERYARVADDPGAYGLLRHLGQRSALIGFN